MQRPIRLKWKWNKTVGPDAIAYGCLAFSMTGGLPCGFVQTAGDSHAGFVAGSSLVVISKHELRMHSTQGLEADLSPKSMFFGSLQVFGAVPCEAAYWPLALRCWAWCWQRCLPFARRTHEITCCDRVLNTASAALHELFAVPWRDQIRFSEGNAIKLSTKKTTRASEKNAFPL